MTRSRFSCSPLAALALALACCGPAAAATSDADTRDALAACPWAYDEYLLRHIFIGFSPLAAHGEPRTEAQALARARALKGRLDAGEDFSRLAQSESDDASSARLGGELSSIFGVYMDDAFLDAVRGLAVGATAGPTRGPEGYHLIRLEERHPASFATVKALVEQQREDVMHLGARAWPAGCARPASAS